MVVNIYINDDYSCFISTNKLYPIRLFNVTRSIDLEVWEAVYSWKSINPIEHQENFHFKGRLKGVMKENFEKLI